VSVTFTALVAPFIETLPWYIPTPSQGCFAQLAVCTVFPIVTVTVTPSLDPRSAE
jgi:hypothetical protein